MDKFYIRPTNTTPEVNFSPDENIFLISGISTPEDVRAMYYPVIEWVKAYVNDILQANSKIYTSEFPLRFRTDLKYFNSSSAKFLHDIFLELKRLMSSGIPFVIEWVYDVEDIDLKEAGVDIASLVELEFLYISKTGNIR